MRTNLAHKGIWAAPGAVLSPDEALLSSVAWVDREEVFIALNAWLADTSKPHALVLGRAGRGKSTVLARWMASASELRGATVVHLPIGRTFATALEREFVGLFWNLLEAAPSGPMGISTAWMHLAERLSEGREPDEAPLVVIIDGADEALDFHVDATLLGHLGAGVRVVVAAEGDAARWLSQLGWSESTTIVVDVPPLDDGSIGDLCDALDLPDASPHLTRSLAEITGGEPLMLQMLLNPSFSGRTVGSTTPVRELPGPGADYAEIIGRIVHDRIELPGFERVLKVMSRAVGPLSSRDIEVVLGDARDLLQIPRLCQSLSSAQSVLVEVAGGYVYSNEQLRRSIDERLSSEERRAIDERYLGWGRAMLAALRAGQPAPEEISAYLIEYYRLHLHADSATLDGAAVLCTPEWLGAWLTRPCGFAGFVSDIQKTRSLAVQIVERGVDLDERACALGLQVRCALIQSSLTTLVSVARRLQAPSAPPTATAESDEEEGEEGQDREVGHAPRRAFGDVTINLELRLGDGAARARALVVLAENLSSEAREQVLTWAHVAALEAPRSGGALLAVAVATPAPRRQMIAHEAAAVLASLASIEDLCGLVRVVALLPEDEAGPLLARAFECAAQDPDWTVPFIVCAAELPARLIGLLWRRVPELSEQHRPVAWAWFAPRMPDDLRSAALEHALASLLEFGAAGGVASEIARDLVALAPYLPEQLIRKELANAALYPPAAQAFAEALGRLGHGAEAIAILRGLRRAEGRFEGLARVLPFLMGAEKAALALELEGALERASRGECAAAIHASAANLCAGIHHSSLARIARSTGTLWAISAIAEHLAGPLRDEVVAELVSTARGIPDLETDRLFVLPPNGSAMTLLDASYLFGRLTAYLAECRRDDMLESWNGNDFQALVPLLSRIGGEAAVFGAAREIVETARWFP